jgi:uncharacterized membrane protein
MTYTQLAYLHLATVLPAFGLGAFQLLGRKGTRNHRVLGRIYMLFMLATGFITFSMPAKVGPQLFHHFGFIHIFSVLAIFGVPIAYFAARRGYLRAHRFAMIWLYVGGILIAGAFAFSPGRMLHKWLFG